MVENHQYDYNFTWLWPVRNPLLCHTDFKSAKINTTKRITICWYSKEGKDTVMPQYSSASELVKPCAVSALSACWGLIPLARTLWVGFGTLHRFQNELTSTEVPLYSIAPNCLSTSFLLTETYTSKIWWVVENKLNFAHDFESIWFWQGMA